MALLALPGRLLHEQRRLDIHLEGETHCLSTSEQINHAWLC